MPSEISSAAERQRADVSLTGRVGWQGTLVRFQRCYSAKDELGKSDIQGARSCEDVMQENTIRMSWRACRNEGRGS